MVACMVIITSMFVKCVKPFNKQKGSLMENSLAKKLIAKQICDEWLIADVFSLEKLSSIDLLV